MKTRKCEIEGCERKHWGKGFCSMHYTRVRQGIADMRPEKLPVGGWGWQKRPRKGVCSIEGCKGEHYALGFCHVHYARRKRTGSVFLKPKPEKPPCSIKGCKEKSKFKGYCQFHYGRKINNIPLTRPKGNKGSLNVNWNGGVSEYPNHYDMKKIRIQVLAEEKNTCHYCGAHTNQIHHKDHSRDNHVRENLTACCHRCNLSFAGPKKTSKYIRIYGQTLSGLAKRHSVSTITIFRWHKRGELQWKERHSLNIACM